MRPIIVILTVFFLAMSIHAKCQIKLYQGFKMLEDGQHNEASAFFSNYLEKNGNDRRPLICYGSAVGLSGKTWEAVRHFEKMDDQYQEDPEIRLKLAKAFLWNDSLSYDAIFFSRFGVYVQAGSSFLSESNRKNCLFLSLYYKTLNYPQLKAGVNLHIFVFKTPRPDQYYNPGIFRFAEIFTMFQKLPFGEQKFIVRVELA